MSLSAVIASLALAAQSPAQTPGLILSVDGSSGDVAATPAAPSTVLGRDTRGRPTLTARFNGQGPFAMVLDTGAQTSLVSTGLVDELDLPELDGGLGVNGVSGAEQARLFAVDRFQTDLFDADSVAVPALPNQGVTEARGIVGMEMLASGRLVFDQIAYRIRLEPSGGPHDGYAVIQGRLNDAGLLVVPVEIDGVKLDALVDTGAAISVVSGAAAQVLGWAEDDPRIKAAGVMRGAAGQGAAVQSAVVGHLAVGPVTFRDLNLFFSAQGGPSTADSSPPTFILGSDLLNNLEAFAVDFPKAQLLIRIPSRD